MTPEQLEAQSREAIKAWCDDPSVQLEYKFKTDDFWSAYKEDIKKFLLDVFDYRISKPKRWYRVAKMQDALDTDPYILQATSRECEDQIENSKDFVKWLDERKYYE